ncbi:MAG TPA: bifunctional adenosylcobinamide kinase/adenosylcobinamide-phosphate guanylyltransferase [Lentibacillus sp.]|uniref:bifunctional adenosylcobinamide kinase/adenosylcobinamide-phosphate guanylyltransferase n=1 Tax=Lentibacillus sp. TaxID=1925746 RepID=UPI002B4AFC1F|nr:bifunctional adenosylcobinamide kinase/adenosylcobinamide-phosphate guanylyltransferase [Lentibacillus sp.]HLR61550.1 bifunctional adenosylcobinamide kinase/adenosylcobinamide-phosphate guanylyltransferase [Lentibacillus sp.]
MHFITGGAFNGKRKWVKNFYAADRHLWLSAYEADALTNSSDGELPAVVVLEGLEKWIYKQIDTAFPPDTTRQNVMNQIEPWLEWEKADSYRRLVIIGTDISKGIVPVDKRERLWRDVTAWVYQDLTARAKRADVIWYGMEQTLKDE